MKQVEKLSKEQREEFDKIQIERKGTEKAMDIAMRCYSALMAEYLKAEKEIWKKILEQHNLDPSKTYRTEHIGEETVVVIDREI